MSKGGGSGASTTQTTQTNPDALAAYKNAVTTGTNVAQQPAPVYNSPLVAGFNPTQQSAFENINNAAGLAQPYIGQAANLVQASTSGIDPFASAQQNMSPYISGVLNSQMALQKQQDAQQQQQLAGTAASAGAFGGDRSTIAGAELAGQQALANNATNSQTLQQGYNTALQTGLQQQQANAWLDSQGAFALGNLGQEAQSQAMSGAAAQLGAGNQQQQLAQQQLAAPYSQFQAAQGYPFTISNFLSSLASGTAGAGSTNTTTPPAPSSLSQAVGLGATGLGVYNAFNNAGAFGSGAGPANLTNLAAQNAGTWSTDLAQEGPWTDVGSAVVAARGGRIGGHAGLSGPVHVGTQHHYDYGGPVMSLGDPTGGLSMGAQAGLGSGNPQASNQQDQFAKLPTEQLHEMAVRFPPGSQQGAAIRAMLQRRMMNPGSDPANAPAPALGVPGMWRGGATHYAAGGGDDLDPAFDPTTGGASTDPDFSLRRPLPDDDMRLSNAQELLRQLGTQNDNRDLETPEAPSGGMRIGATPRAVPPGLSAPSYAAPGQDVPLSVAGGPSTAGLGAAFDPVSGGATVAGDAGPADPDTLWTDAPAARRPAPVRTAGLGRAQPIPVQPPAPPGAPLSQIKAEGLRMDPRGYGYSQQLDGPQPGFIDRLTTGSSGALLAAGLGMLAGRSPYAAENIGAGGLGGLRFAQDERQRLATNALKQQQEIWNHEYQLARTDNQANRNETYADRVASQATVDNARSQRLMAQAMAGVASHTSMGDLSSLAINEAMQGHPERLNALRELSGKNDLQDYRLRQGDRADDALKLRMDQFQFLQDNQSVIHQMGATTEEAKQAQLEKANILNANRTASGMGGKLQPVPTDAEALAAVRARRDTAGPAQVPLPSRLTTPQAPALPSRDQLIAGNVYRGLPGVPGGEGIWTGTGFVDPKNYVAP